MRRTICFLLANSLLLASCMSAPRVVGAPASYIPIQRPSRIWITNPAGQTVEVEQPRVLGDSLYGRTLGGQEVWVPLDGSEGTVKARQLDKTKTYLAVGGVLGAVALGAMLMSGGGQSQQFLNEDSYVGRHILFNIAIHR